MIVIAQQPGVGGAPNRAIVLPKNGPIFGYWLVVIQISQPAIVFIGSNKREAGLDQIGPIQDGLQFSVANEPNPIWFLWRGEMWVSASAPNTPFVMIIPGMQEESLPCDTTV